jgi:hypothetical protein
VTGIAVLAGIITAEELIGLIAEQLQAIARLIGREQARTKLPLKETLIKSFDELRTSGKLLISFMVSLSNHERNQLNQSFLKA